MPAAPERTTTTLVEALRSVLSQVAEPIVVLRTILEQAVERTTADRGVFVEVTGEGGLDYRVLHGFRTQHLEGDAGRFSRHIFARVLKAGEPLRLRSATEDPELGLFLMLAVMLGSRRGELCSLRWTDVDFDHGEVLIDSGVIYVPGRPLIDQDRTKNYTKRRVAVGPATLELLRAHRVEQAGVGEHGAVGPGGAELQRGDGAGDAEGLAVGLVLHLVGPHRVEAAGGPGAGGGDVHVGTVGQGVQSEVEVAGHVGGGDGDRGLQEVAHGFACADDRAQHCVRGELFAQGFVFPGQGHVFQCPLQGEAQVVEVQRLGQIVVGPFFHRLDSRLDSSLCGQDNYGVIAAIVFEGAQ